MAILKHFPGLQVEMLVNGSPLQEHSGPDDILMGSSSTKWIEAHTDQDFKVRVTFSEPFSIDHAVSMRIFCDGTELAQTIQQGKDLHKATGHTYSGVPVKRDTQDLRQRFYFKALETTESESMLNTQLTETVEEIGVITIAFQFAEGIRKLAKTKTSGPKRLETPTRVPEKAMKGDEKSHIVGLGPVEEALSPTKFMKWKDVGTPFARFHFKYRSREVLQALGVLDGGSVSQPDFSRESTFQPEEKTTQESPNTLETSDLLDELLEGEKHLKRKAENMSIKQEPDVVPQRKTGSFWLKDEEADRKTWMVKQRVDIVPRNTTYGRLLKEADDEERETLAQGEKYPGKKQRL